MRPKHTGDELLEGTEEKAQGLRERLRTRTGLNEEMKMKEEYKPTTIIEKLKKVEGSPLDYIQFTMFDEGRD